MLYTGLNKKTNSQECPITMNKRITLSTTNNTRKLTTRIHSGDPAVRLTDDRYSRKSDRRSRNGQHCRHG